VKKGLSEIVLVLDRSGSMSSTRSDAEGGLRQFIDKQRVIPGECRVTFYRFDNEIERIFDNKPLSEIKQEDLVLEPRGMTALLDAMGQAIDEVGKRLSKTPEDERPEKVFFVTITDGCENASRTESKYTVQDKVTRQRDKYQWEFHFIGATLDAIATAAQVGILPQYTLAYSGSKIGTQNSYNALASNVASTRGTGVSVSYSNEDRTSAMEK
jgi:uncharacterized protein YegL